MENKHTEFTLKALNLLSKHSEVEDGLLWIRKAFKYDMYNLCKRLFPEFVYDMERELEVDEI